MVIDGLKGFPEAISAVYPDCEIMGAGADRVQLTTYPQSPFSGPARCCDVTDLYQAFSQRTSPGRLWISLDAGLLFVLDWGGPKSSKRKPSQKEKPQQFQ